VDLIIQGEGQMSDRVPRVARIAPRLAFAERGTSEWIQSLLCEVSIGNVKNIEHFQKYSIADFNGQGEEQ
jgi:hypothetical protein